MSLRRAYTELHFAVILLAFTAILGDLISLSASVLVWWRTLIATAGIGIFLLLSQRLNYTWLVTQSKIYWLGALISVHWLCFFGSIKLANASTALICFATISFFTAWIEPWITGRKRMKHEIVFGCMIIPGIILIAGKASGDLLTGIILGVAAALLVSIIASLEKKWIMETDPEHMTLIQLAGAWVCMCLWIGGELIFGSIQVFIPSGIDWLYLIILGVVCTSFAWVLVTRAIRHISAYDQIMVINMEPVYGILMALLVLKDGRELYPTFYAGTVIILASVILHPIWQKKYATH